MGHHVVGRLVAGHGLPLLHVPLVPDADTRRPGGEAPATQDLTRCDEVSLFFVTDNTKYYLPGPGAPAVRAGGPLGQVGCEVPPVHLSSGLMTEVSQEPLIAHLATVLTHLVTEHHL